MKTFFSLFFVSVIMLGALVSCGCKKKLVVINVLEPELYEDCHIKSSINVPFDKLEAYAATLSKNTPVVLYCSNYRCMASGIGAQMLKNLGMNSVYAYEGGMAEWYQHKLPVEGPCKQAYLTMDNPPVRIETGSEVNVITWQELLQKMK